MAEWEEDAVRIGRAWRELRRGALSAEFRDRVYGAGLDVGQADALELLVVGGGCRMAELAAALRVDASTATRAVLSRAVDEGLVRPDVDLDHTVDLLVGPMVYRNLVRPDAPSGPTAARRVVDDVLRALSPIPPAPETS